MTEAHDNAHADAREQLAAIDAWQAADAAYRAAHEFYMQSELPPVNDGVAQAAWNDRSEKFYARDYTAMAVTGLAHDNTQDATLAAFTTLARAYRTLEAERDAAVAKIERALRIEARDHYLGEGAREWGAAAGANDMRDEFRATLTDGEA